MLIPQSKIFKYISASLLFILWPQVSFSDARIIIKNFCYQPVTLHAVNAYMDCEPAGIDLPKNKNTKLKVSAGSAKVCSPWDDNGQGSYYVEIEQQDPPRELSPQVFDLTQDGKLSFYCANSGPLGPCQCSSLSEASNNW